MMINRQQLNLALLSSQSLEPIRVDLRGLDQTSALPRPDNYLKALRPREVAPNSNLWSYLTLQVARNWQGRECSR